MANWFAIDNRVEVYIFFKYFLNIDSNTPCKSLKGSSNFVGPFAHTLQVYKHTYPHMKFAQGYVQGLVYTLVGKACLSF